MILLDSNVLLRLPDKMSPQRPIARQAILSLHRRNEILVIVPQNLYEFWAVSTRPSGRPNGMGMPAERSELWLNYLQRTFNLLPETEAFLQTWRNLMAVHKTVGFKAHDSRLVAAMPSSVIKAAATWRTSSTGARPTRRSPRRPSTSATRCASRS